jgi:hypothetical protein
MTPRTFALGLGIAAIVVGIFLLVQPVNVTVNGTTVACGTATNTNTAASDQDDMLSSVAAFNGLGELRPTTFEDACASALSARGPWGWALAAVGVVVVVGARRVRWAPRDGQV